MATHRVSVNWTGSYPCLCSGQWEIVVDGIPLTGIESNPFHTYGNYASWHFGEDWDEQWEYHNSGLDFDEWFKETPNGLRESLQRHGFTITEELMKNLYDCINEVDWQHGSCGGCI